MRTKPPQKTSARKKAATPILTSTVQDRPKVPGAPHMVGYARVSMSDQDNQRQVDELVSYGVGLVYIFSDTASGRTMNRPGWEHCWQELQAGDMLVIISLDRLGRNLEEIIRVERAIREKGCTLKSLKEDINTSSPTGRLMFHLIAAMAQWEREWGLERTMHGLAKARERGNVGGRKQQFSDDQIEDAVKQHGTNRAAKELGCDRVTVIRRMKAIETRRRTISALNTLMKVP